MLSFKIMSLQDILVIGAFAVGFSGLTYLFNFMHIQHYFIYISLFAFMMAFIALLVSKVGSLMLFSIISGVLLYPIPQLSSTGITEIIILLTTAFTFEFIAIITKRNLVCVVFATLVSVAIMPITMLLIVGQFYRTLVVATINFSILCAIFGFFASLLAIGVWELIKTQKFIIKLRVLS